MDDQQFWDLAFLQIAGWQFHPGNPVDNRVSVVDCAALADQLLIERNKRAYHECWPTGRGC